MVLFSKVASFKKVTKQILAVALVFCLLAGGVKTYQKNKNQLEINVVALKNSVDCVFIKQDKNYFIGVADNSEDLKTQANYINNCAGKIDCLVVLSRQQAENLNALLALGVKIDKIYAPVGITLPDFSGLPAQVLSPENAVGGAYIQNNENTIIIQDGQIIISDYGALIEYKDKTVLISNAETERIADVAITQNPQIYAETVISCDQNHKNNKKVYFTSVSGRVKIKITDTISVETFR